MTNTNTSELLANYALLHRAKSAPVRAIEHGYTYNCTTHRLDTPEMGHHILSELQVAAAVVTGIAAVRATTSADSTRKALADGLIASAGGADRAALATISLGTTVPAVPSEPTSIDDLTAAQVTELLGTDYTVPVSVGIPALVSLGIISSIPESDKAKLQKYIDSGAQRRAIVEYVYTVFETRNFELKTGTDINNFTGQLVLTDPAKLTKIISTNNVSPGFAKIDNATKITLRDNDVLVPVRRKFVPAETVTEAETVTV